MPTHRKPCGDSDFGQYLAGLIDGNGHFNTQRQLCIAFHSADAPLAYFVKSSIGFGSVRSVKNKNAITFTVSSYDGIARVMSLISGKLRTEHRYGQAVRNVLNHPSFSHYALANDFTRNSSPIVEDYWLCGFSDAEASFQVKMLAGVDRKKIRLNFQVDQKTESILADIRNYLGGNVYHRDSQDTYYYGSTSFGVAKKVIRYFDKYPMLSYKHVNYLR